MCEVGRKAPNTNTTLAGPLPQPAIVLHEKYTAIDYWRRHWRGEKPIKV